MIVIIDFDVDHGDDVDDDHDDHDDDVDDIVDYDDGYVDDDVWYWK